jgi:disulfide bond formation protein DsbB
MNANRIALALGTVALALLLGALWFQYAWGYPPCEMCWWQRYPHIVAVLVGLGGGALIELGLLDAKFARPVAALTILCLAMSGGIAVFHAGVEWHWWKGPRACTGDAFHGPLNLNEHVVLCDIAAWRLFGLSLAGYNAIASLGAAFLGTLGLLKRIG